eukprot:scaffold7683_cov212-Ochromonas_danica.AAC.1
MKYNVNGTKLMTRLYGTASNDSCYGLAVDSKGSICMVGSTMGSLNGAAMSGNIAMFVMKLSEYGTVIFTRIANAISNTVSLDVAARGVAIDSSDSIYVTGYIPDDGGMNGIYLIYNSSGFETYNVYFGDPGSREEGLAITYSNNGYTYYTGVYMSYLSWVKINSNGDVLNYYIISEAPKILDYNIEGDAISFDNTNNMLIAGSVNTTSYNNNTDIILLKYTPNSPMPTSTPSSKPTTPTVEPSSSTPSSAPSVVPS